LVRRITDAQQQVQQIALGKLDQVKIAGPDDQLTSLTRSVNSMANELRSMWRTIRETERSRLLSQVAGGLAHQLRNAITGIHLAVQLHRRDCPLTDQESLKIAEAELARTAAYIQQLLHSAAGKEQSSQPGSVDEVLSEAQSLLQTIANHRRIGLEWKWDAAVAGSMVADQELLRSAVMNLVLNALDAAGPGGDVVVRSQREKDSLTIAVEDSGPGPTPELGEHLFDPFVSSKPEGLGVGLTVVRSAAEAFGGRASWFRQGDRTVFELKIQTSPHE
jgi:signal transduction histidine kinase